MRRKHCETCSTFDAECPRCCWYVLGTIQEHRGEFVDTRFSAELRCANIARIPDFGYGNGLHDWSLAERSNELQGEAGELGNVFKKLRRIGRHAPMPPELIAHAMEELADCYICLSLIEAEAGWTVDDVEQAIRRKFNKTSRAKGSIVRL